MIYLALALVVVTMVYLFIWSLCRVSADADELMERIRANTGVPYDPDN